MTIFEGIQIGLLFLLWVLCTPLLGRYMARLYQGENVWLSPLLRPIERTVYRLAGVQADAEMDWKHYLGAMLAFNVAGFGFLLLLQLGQSRLPMNPASLPNVNFLLAFNTATSFMTNTNWQAYGGETTMSYLTQMLGLNVQNFVSAATGMAVVILR
ncbi:MAG: potassium-transporting ATPase subunit KdpA [Caldilineaceae bacterium]